MAKEDESQEYFVADGNSRINLQDVPLRALRPTTKELLSVLLNGIKILPSEEGYLRDWRGMQHFAGLKSEYASVLTHHRDPTGELIERWAQKSESCNLAQFQKYLEVIDRWDVIADTNQCFLEDAENYINLKEKNGLVVKLPDLSLDDVLDDNESLLLTEDDVKLAQQGLPPQQYHAFVLYADEDIEFATEVIEKMEDYGLKICDKSRDLLGGTLSHEAILRLISERCNRLIVIVSPAFLKSRANTFFTSCAQSIGIKQDRRKIVPCLYKNCILPPQLSFYFVLRYEQSGKLYNFWEKLRQSIQSSESYKMALPVGVLSPKIIVTESESKTLEPKVTLDDPMKKAAFYPPIPKLRSTNSSMWDLSSTADSDFGKPQFAKSSEQNGVNLKPRSPNKLLSKLGLNEKFKSKSFWDLSTSSSTANIQDNVSVNDFPSPLSALSKKQKWYKKFLTPKAHVDNVDRPATPTSCRSLDPSLLIAPNPPTDKPEKKRWYKRKLLA